MAYDYSKLAGRIVEKFGTREKFSTAMGLSRRTLSLKMNGKVEWKQNEILLACKLLDLKSIDIPSYFFILVVQ